MALNISHNSLIKCMNTYPANSNYPGRLGGILLAVTMAASACAAFAGDLPALTIENRQTTAESLLAEIRLITAGDTPAAEQHRQIALLVARVVVHLHEAAPPVIAAVAAEVDADFLPVITAAAVVSAGYQSHAMYAALLASTGNMPELREAIMLAARTPSSALDTRTLATLPVVPMPPPVLPAPAASDVHFGDIPLEVYERPVGVAERTPMPPPRPPAPRYRGQ